MARSTNPPPPDLTDPSDIWDIVRARPVVAPPRRRRVGLIVGVVIGCAIVLLFIADLAWSGWSAYRGMSRAKSELQVGSTHLLAGDLTEAGSVFQRAGNDAAGAAAALGHPSMTILGRLPWIGDDVKAVRQLATSESEAGLGAMWLVDAAQAASYDGGGIPGFSAGGRVNPGVIERATPAILHAEQLLGDAAARVSNIHEAGLISSVAHAVAQARAELVPRAALAHKAALAAQLLPGFLGGDGPRTYLLVMLQPTQPRGGGGYPGMYSLLHLDGRSITLDQLRPTTDIPSVDPVSAPPGVRRRYGPRDALTTFRNTTYSPDFPTDARLMMAIWAAAGHPHVDGVIAGDASLLSGIMRATGPMTTRVWPAPIASGNVEQILGRDTYRYRHYKKANHVQTTVGTAIWNYVLRATWAPGPMYKAIGGAAGTRDLQVYSATDREERTLSQLGVDGAVKFGTEQPPLVVYQALSANRVGYYASSTHSVQQHETTDGTVVTFTVRLHNGAPDGPASQLLGLPRNGPVGRYEVEMDVYLPPGAHVLSGSVDGRSGQVVVDQEFGRPVAVQHLVAGSGETTVAILRYLIPS